MFNINGIPMIEHVYNNVTKKNNVNLVYMMRRFIICIQSINGNVIYTSSSHQKTSIDVLKH